MSAKTKTVEYWVDLYPGWHDDKYKPGFYHTPPPTPKPEGGKRIRILVDFPCVGAVGVDATVRARVEEVKP